MADTLARQRSIHFIGIGGAGMSSLARVVLQLGHRVTGSDLVPNRRTELLAREGATFYQGHDSSNIEGADLIVASDAIPEDNVELEGAKSQGLVILRRGQMLALVCEGKRTVAVAGSHGKTTSCAMIAHILESAGVDPTVIAGGEIAGLRTGGKLGSGDVAVVEACEAFNAILDLKAQVGLITSLDPDHLDYHGSFEALKRSIVEFGKASRSVVACADDKEVADIVRRVGGAVTSYGETGADLRISDLEIGPQGTRFSLSVPDGKDLVCELPVPGRHMAQNAAGAIGSCALLGVVPADSALHLRDFESPARRFEVLGEFAGVLLVDDYAHHPREIAELIAAARSYAPGRRLVAAFQPHMYSRTILLMDDFAESLAAADRVLVLETYPAREQRKKEEGTLTAEELASARALAEATAARAPGLPSDYAPSLEEAARLLTAEVSPGDFVLTIGAGDVDRVAGALASELGGAKHTAVRQ